MNNEVFAWNLNAFILNHVTIAKALKLKIYFLVFHVIYISNYFSSCIYKLKKFFKISETFINENFAKNKLIKRTYYPIHLYYFLVF